MKKYIPAVILPLPLRKKVEVNFSGGNLTSDSGVLLLAEADRSIGLTQRMADGIREVRQQSKVEHTAREMMQSRVLAIAAGYEDANDLNSLRHDPALKLSCGQAPVSGAPLASQPTLSRYENGLTRADVFRMATILGQAVIDQLPKNTRCVTIDIDATDDPCHGQQEFEGFHKYYDNHCYLPLLVQLTGDDGEQRPIAALLRPGRTPVHAGVRSLLKRIVAALRTRFPEIEITVRADGAFGCKPVLGWLDGLRVKYLLGLPSNPVLADLGSPAIARCVKNAKREGDGHCEYGSFLYQAGSWPSARRVAIKVESICGQANARYVVTNLWHTKAEAVYRTYCGRGDFENRIKELKLDLGSGRTSCHRFLANQARLLMHLAAYVLWNVVRRAAGGTAWARMQVGTLRLQLVKVAARVAESTRRICIQLCSSYPFQHDWQKVQARLSASVTGGSST